MSTYLYLANISMYRAERSSCPGPCAESAKETYITCGIRFVVATANYDAILHNDTPACSFADYNSACTIALLTIETCGSIFCGGNTLD